MRLTRTRASLGGDSMTLNDGTIETINFVIVRIGILIVGRFVGVFLIVFICRLFSVIFPLTI